MQNHSVSFTIPGDFTGVSLGKKSIVADLWVLLLLLHISWGGKVLELLISILSAISDRS